MSITRMVCWCGLLLALLVLAGGCKRARREVEHVEVSGKVLYRGKPVTGGRVAFVAKDGFASTGIIDEKGHYTIQAPVGEVTITVDNRDLDPTNQNSRMAAAKKGAGRPGEGDPTPLKGKYVEIPGKYTTPDTSGLKYTVTNGPQTHDLQLSD